MAEFTALFLIAIFYVIPLNIVLYNLCERFAEYLLRTIPNPPFKFLLYISSDYLTPTIYVLIFVALFLLFYFLLSNVIIKSLVIFKNININKWSAMKYFKGQKSINITARIIIILLIALQVFLKVIDIKVIILGVLCLLFVFVESKPKNIKKHLMRKAPETNK
jgi:hypothetical protein